MILVWALYGRERGTGYDREYEQAPPTDTEPALVPPLLRQDEAAGSQEFTATLFDLIRRGRYKSTPVDDGAKGLGRPAPPGHLRPAAHARRHEHAAAASSSTRRGRVDSVIDTDGERLSQLREKIEADRSANAKRFTSFKNAVGSAIDGKKWYVEAGGRMLGLGLVDLHRPRRGPALDRRRRLALGVAALE